MKLFSSEHVYDHEWKTVTFAAQNKYPNPFSSHVVAVDVLNRHIDDQGILVSERLITYKGFLPSWLKSVTGVSMASANTYIHEITKVNVHTGEMELESENVTGREYMSVTEKCNYARQGAVTKFTQTAEMKAGYGWSMVKAMLESKMVERFDNSAAQGRRGLQYVIDNLEESVGALSKNVDEMSKEIDHALEEAKCAVAQNVDEAIGIAQVKMEDVKDMIKSATDP